MRSGKAAESVLKRSVLKQIKTKREEVVQGAAIGRDCAFFSFPEDELTAVSTAGIIVSRQEEISPLVTAAVNNVAAGGALPTALLVTAFLPENTRESELKELMGEVEAVCDRLQIQAAGGHTQITGAAEVPLLSLTVVGRTASPPLSYAYRPGQDVVMTKWAGLLGTALLAGRNREILAKRLPMRMIEEAIAFKRYASVVPEAATAVKSNVSGMHDVSGGGVFAALWELAEQADVGLEIELKKIPVKQETIEICEVLEKNPYMLQGGGALLMVCDGGSRLVRRMEESGIPAAVIGKITEEKGKVVVNGEERRYLDRPKTDEIDRR